MIRHIVMWKFREGTEEKANEFLTKLAALDGVIPQLKKSEGGLDARTRRHRLCGYGENLFEIQGLPVRSGLCRGL